MNIAIIGGGVFSWSFLWKFSQLLSLQSSRNFHVKITFFITHKSRPSCSLNSTALVARRNYSFGISPLGDLIQQSWFWWTHVVETYQLTEKQGVMLAPLFYDPKAHERRLHFLNVLPKSESVLHRHSQHSIEPSFLIEPKIWLDFLHDDIQKNCHIGNVTLEIQNREVQKIDMLKMEVFLKNNTLQFDRLIVQPGAYLIEGMDIVDKEETVYGSFLDFSNVQNFSDKSFSFSGDYHLYYRKPMQSLQLGIYSSKTSCEETEWMNLTRIYQQALTEGWLLPPLNTAQKKTGGRHKLKHRLPIIGNKGHCYYHLGGYKIGYLVSLFQASQLANTVFKNL